VDIVGVDPEVDLAVLRFHSGRSLSHVLSFQEEETLRVGDWLISMGSPGGVLNAVTVGVLSARGRVPHGTFVAESFVDYLFTDALVGPGNSGGPVLDLKGYVVGVNAAVLGGEGGLGVVIPSRLVERVVRALERNGACAHSSAGVLVADEPALAGNAAIRVTWSDSGEGTSGLHKGDRILKINGDRVWRAREFEWREFMAEPGTKWVLEMMREGQRISVTLILRRISQEIFAQEHGAGAQTRRE
jgi:S1-C subfamily serine protease